MSLSLGNPLAQRLNRSLSCRQSLANRVPLCHRRNFRQDRSSTSGDAVQTLWRKQRSRLAVGAKLDLSAAKLDLSVGKLIDSDQEAARKYRRTVADHTFWRAHRSGDRYVRHIRGLASSRIVLGLLGPLIYVTSISVALCTYESLRASGLLPEPFAHIGLAVGTTAPFTLTSFALSLLLVFRTNTSYARWAEARQLWGGIINRTRDVTRQALAYIEPDEQRGMMQRWTIAYPYSVSAFLRGDDSDLEADLKDVLQPEELAGLMSAQHKTNYVLQVMGHTLTTSGLEGYDRMRMDENLTFFADAVGACERIFRTPIPLTYTRHTSRFLIFWLTFMPFTLWQSQQWGTVPASVVIAFLLVAIDEIGVQIEEPFGVLPLEVLCGTIRKNIDEMHSQNSSIDVLIPQSSKHAGQQSGAASGTPNGAHTTL